MDINSILKCKLNYFVIIFAVLMGCSEDTLSLKYNNAYAKWNNLNISSYKIKYKKRCLCIDDKNEIYLTVKDEKIIESKDSLGKIGKVEVKLFTINELFMLTKKIIAEDKGMIKKIEYDKKFGFPKVVSLDDPKKMDDEFLIEVTEFVEVM